jgi:hypothetical protein
MSFLVRFAKGAADEKTKEPSGDGVDSECWIRICKPHDCHFLDQVVCLMIIMLAIVAKPATIGSPGGGLCFKGMVNLQVNLVQ